MPEGSASSDEGLERRVSVLLPLPLAGAYDYRVPPELNVARGDFVAVPLGNRKLAGVLWGAATGEVEAKKLKFVAARLDAPALTEELRRLIDWVANYTLSPPGAVLRMAMSVPDALDPPRPLAAYALSDEGRAALASDDKTLTKTRRRVLEIAVEGFVATAADLAERAACGVGVVRALASAGLLAPVDLPRHSPPPRPVFRAEGVALSPAQHDAARELASLVDSGGFSVTLLDGVTGSGKTEVYFAAIAACLQKGKQALVLLPEIALSAQWLNRFAERFGVLPALWHSELGHAQRRDTWRDVAAGRAAVLVGARSALFLPFPDLGLIIID